MITITHIPYKEVLERIKRDYIDAIESAENAIKDGDAKREEFSISQHHRAVRALSYAISLIDENAELRKESDKLKQSCETHMKKIQELAEKWADKYNKEVSRLNKRITELEASDDKTALKEMKKKYARLQQEITDLKKRGKKITPEQLHEWYLEAITSGVAGEQYNPKAVKPFDKLSEEQRVIDKYIAHAIHKAIFGGEE